MNYKEAARLAGLPNRRWLAHILAGWLTREQAHINRIWSQHMLFNVELKYDSAVSNILRMLSDDV